MGHARSRDRVVIRSNGAKQTIPGQLLRVTPDDGGYPTVCLRDGKRKRQVRIHILVLEAWVGPRPPGTEGLHRNDVKTDARLDNLRWGTRLQNVADAERNGRAWWVKQRARDAAAE